MRRRILSIALLTASATWAQLNAAAAGMIESEITAKRGASNQAMRQRDVKAFAETLDQDYLIVRGNGSTAGREAYLEQMGRTFADPQAIRYQRTMVKLEISNAAPLAAEHGRWTATLPDGKPAYSGSYLAMWRRTAQGWKIRSELFVVIDCVDAAACAAYRAQAAGKPR